MSRIEGTFERLKAEKKKAFITFITAGDPDMGATKELILSLERSGADIIELGIPFSDPMADGPTIQASYERALKNNVRISHVLELIRDLRKESQIPVILFGYYNPVFNYGLKKFAKDLKAAGADGALIVDLPPEEAGPLKDEFDKNGLDLIFLLTPTSDDRRMRLVAEKASGFVYFVSVTGVTGARKALSKGIAGKVRSIRKFTDVPVGVGFGISTPEQAKEVASFADGVVVGSAIINVIAGNADSKERLIKEASGFAASIRRGIG